MSDSFDRALRAAARRTQAADVCPEAAILAAYADNGLSGDERRDVERHAADCPRCLEHLSLLGAVSLDREAPEPSRSWLLRWGWLVPVATAVLVVAVWVRLPEQKVSDQGARPPLAPQVAARREPTAQDSLAAAPSADRDARAKTVGRAAPTVAAPGSVRPAQPGEFKSDHPTSLERQDAGRQNAETAPPAVRAEEAQQTGAETAIPRRVGEVAGAAAAPAAPAAVADALKEDVRAAESDRRRQAPQLAKSSAGPASIIVSASAKESYRLVGDRIDTSEDAGRSWRTVLSEPQTRFTAAGCAEGGPCWFGTADGQVLRRTPTGFARAVLPSRTRVVAIAPVGPQMAVVTIEGGQRFRSTDGGVTWVPIP